MIKTLLAGCSKDQTIPCEAMEDDGGRCFLGALKALPAVSVIPCDEKKRKAVALQEVRLERIRSLFDSREKKRKKLSPVLKNWVWA